MWTLPEVGIVLLSSALSGRFLTFGPPGKSRSSCFFNPTTLFLQPFTWETPQGHTVFITCAHSEINKPRGDVHLWKDVHTLHLNVSAQCLEESWNLCWLVSIGNFVRQAQKSVNYTYCKPWAPKQVKFVSRSIKSKDPSKWWDALVHRIMF